MELNDLNKLYSYKKEASMPFEKKAYVPDTKRGTVLESIITLKAYDQCRQQLCLENKDLLPSREIIAILPNGELEIGNIIEIPVDASDVLVKNFDIHKILIVEKNANPFKHGFWDISIRYTFVYDLVFIDMDANEISRVPAMTTTTRKCTLFGSIETDTLIASDLFSALDPSQDNAITNSPYIIVEAKGVALAARLVFDSEGMPKKIKLTIGLFAIIELVRLVNLTVESQGFSIPSKCGTQVDIEPCEFFKCLDFPMDVFSPPQINEFMAGESINIPVEEEEEEEYCECCCHFSCDCE